MVLAAGGAGAGVGWGAWVVGCGGGGAGAGACVVGAGGGAAVVGAGAGAAGLVGDAVGWAQPANTRHCGTCHQGHLTRRRSLPYRCAP